MANGRKRGQWPLSQSLCSRRISHEVLVFKNMIARGWEGKKYKNRTQDRWVDKYPKLGHSTIGFNFPEDHCEMVYFITFSIGFLKSLEPFCYCHKMFEALVSQLVFIEIKINLNSCPRKIKLPCSNSVKLHFKDQSLL